MGKILDSEGTENSSKSLPASSKTKAKKIQKRTNCACTGVSQAGRGQYCDYWGRFFPWCYIDTAKCGPGNTITKLGKFDIKQCESSYLTPTSAQNLPTMQRDIYAQVVSKQFMLPPGHLHCKQRVQGIHRGVAVPLCMDCKDGYFLVVDGAIKLPKYKYTKGVGSCRPFEELDWFQDAKRKAQTHTPSDYDCVSYVFNWKGARISVNGQLEKIGERPKGARWRDHVLGYACIAARIMTGFRYAPRKNYLLGVFLS